ncbi:YeeE/YedE family protein [Hoeflea sp. TYP-13]|uniref:YeeE/YedE family protein n=1 Tax=Hoeflea sp. TYP-13 TaxID=3230023 RepID=UPI0034C6A7C7
MDFVPLIDFAGEPQTLALVGLALGAAFGFLLERTGFCTRSAVLEAVAGSISAKLPMWLIAFATAIISVQLMVFYSVIDVSETRFFSTAQSLSGAAIGGGLFGIGMVLSRGCASRLLVLGASGNLRAIFSVLVLTVVAWATFQGPLVPLRNSLAGLLSTVSLGTNDFAALTGFNLSGPLFGAVAAVVAVVVAARTRLSSLLAASGFAIGALISAGWYLSYSLSTQVFEPIQAESLSYMRPLANSLNYAASGGDESFLSMDIGIIAGTVLGALVSSVLFGSFRVSTFSEPGTPHFLRYAAGAALMGFGGILAVGCTIGAGLTGGSVLAVNSLLALIATLGAGAAAGYLLEVRTGTGNTGTSLAPAE